MFPGSAYPREISQQYTPTTHTEAVHCQRVLLGVFYPCLWPLKAPGSTLGGGVAKELNRAYFPDNGWAITTVNQMQLPDGAILWASIKIFPSPWPAVLLNVLALHQMVLAYVRVAEKNGRWFAICSCGWEASSVLFYGVVVLAAAFWPNAQLRWIYGSVSSEQ